VEQLKNDAVKAGLSKQVWHSALSTSYRGYTEPNRNFEALEARRHWYALYTASNHEKIIEQKLRQREIETFLPLHTVTKRWRNRTTVKLSLPLFAGYVFAKISLAESGTVLRVPRVFSVVGNGREFSSLPDAEIEALRRGLNTLNVTPWPNIKVGIRVKINRGPLAGLEGIVVRNDGKLRVVLSVDMISKSIAVHVCTEDIDVCGEPMEDVARRV
jgi:transcription antitermination factor NusG